jgi:hypothetical protein
MERQVRIYEFLDVLIFLEMFNDETVRKSAQFDVWGFALVLQVTTVFEIQFYRFLGSFDARTRFRPSSWSTG